MNRAKRARQLLKASIKSLQKIDEYHQSLRTEEAIIALEKALIGIEREVKIVEHDRKHALGSSWRQGT